MVRRAVAALDGADVEYLLIGGLASSLLGRPRCTQDVDLLVRAEQADVALEALAEADFDTERATRTGSTRPPGTGSR